MTWFKVDDRFHSHPKAAASTLAALGLWAVAGSWSSDHLTDGFMPDHVVPLLSRGASELADELVAAGLWRRVRGGYQFHQWTSNGDGVKRNPTRVEVEEERRKKAVAGRKGGLASGKTRSKTRSTSEASAKAGASRLVEPPTRPPPSSKEDGERARADAGRSALPATPPVAHAPPTTATPPADLIAEARAQLRAASAKQRTTANQRERRGLDDLRAATPTIPIPTHPEESL